MTVPPMARTSDPSSLQRLAGAVERVPWPAWLLVAVLALISLALEAGVIPGLPEDLASSLLAGESTSTLPRLLAPLLATLCLCAAFVSWRAERLREASFVHSELGSLLAPLQSLTWRDFERLVACHFERLGYAVQRNTQLPEGCDLVVTRADREFLVHGRQWRSARIGVGTVRDLVAAIGQRSAGGGFLVAVGTLSREAHALARRNGIERLDAHVLLTTELSAEASDDPYGSSEIPIPVMQRPPRVSRPPEAQQLPSVPQDMGARALPRPAVPPPRQPAAVPDLAVQSTPAVHRPVLLAPACPRCGTPMVRRVAERGPRAGQAFYSCGDFPRCHGLLAAGD